MEHSFRGVRVLPTHYPATAPTARGTLFLSTATWDNKHQGKPDQTFTFIFCQASEKFTLIIICQNLRSLTLASSRSGVRTYRARWGKPWRFWRAWWTRSRCTAPRLTGTHHWHWCSARATTLAPARFCCPSELENKQTNKKISTLRLDPACEWRVVCCTRGSILEKPGPRTPGCGHSWPCRAVCFLSRIKQESWASFWLVCWVIRNIYKQDLSYLCPSSKKIPTMTLISALSQLCA